MTKVRIASVLALTFGVAALTPGRLGASGPGAPKASANQVTVTVTVVPGQGREGTATDLTAQDVLVYQNQQRRPVVGWKPAESASPLDLAILIDDSLRSNIGLQWNDLRQFIQSLPANAHVAVYYARHGDATEVQDFTTSRQSVMSALRTPIGRANEVSSVFQSVTDLVKHWPQDGNRRTLLVVSDGIDLFYGVADSEPSLNPNLDAAIHATQRNGVTVYAIYANTADNFGRSLYLVNNGQGSLGLLAQQTGGEAYFQELETPVAFAPFLQQLGQRLGQQYLLTFDVAPGKPGYQPVRVTTEQPHVKLVAPTQVYVPGW